MKNDTHLHMIEHVRRVTGWIVLPTLEVPTEPNGNSYALMAQKHNHPVISIAWVRSKAEIVVALNAFIEGWMHADRDRADQPIPYILTTPAPTLETVPIF